MKALRSLSFYLCLALNLSSCLRPRENEALKSHYQSSTSDFIVTSLTAQSTEDKYHGVWNVPEKLTYHFTSCLRDRITQQGINVANPFSIFDENGNQVAKGDIDIQDKCLHWKEGIRFNFFDDQKVVNFKRKIKGQGIYKGLEVVTFGLNPWAKFRDSNQQEFYDNIGLDSPKEQTKDFSLKALGLVRDTNNKINFESSTGKLFINDVAVKISEGPVSKVNNVLKVRLNFRPELQLKNINKRETFSPLQYGRFRFEFSLYLKSKDTLKRSIVAFYAPEEGTYFDFNGGVFNSEEFYLVLNNPITRSSSYEYEIGLKVIPEPGLDSVTSYEGIYQYGDANNLIGEGALPWMSRDLTTNYNPSFRIESFNKKVDSEKIPKESLKYLSSLYFDYLNVAYNQIIKEENINKTIGYTVTSCIKRMLSLSAFNNETFAVTLPDGKTITRVTDENGCFMFPSTLKFYDTQTERYIQQGFVFKHQNSEFKTALQIKLNPWDYGWTFGRDERKFPKEFEKRDKVDPTEFFITGFHYQTIGFNYEIDDFLNLQVKKKVLFGIEPKIIRPNSITMGRTAQEVLKSGYYLLKIGLHYRYLDPLTVRGVLSAGVGPMVNKLSEFKPTQDRSQIENDTRTYVDVIKKVVMIKHGKIITPISFNIRDLRLMRMRAHFAIQLIPIKESELEATLGSSSSVLTKDHINATLRKKKFQEFVQQLKLSESDINSILKRDIDFSASTRDLLKQIELKAPELKKMSLMDVSDSVSHTEALNSLLDEKKLSVDDLTYTEKEAGFKFTTFVGPLTFVYDDNGSYITPSDGNNNFCIDDGGVCNLINNNYKEPSKIPEALKKYSVDYYKTLTVDDLIKEKEKVEVKYYTENRYRSLFVNFLENNNFHYVSMKNTPLTFDPSIFKTKKMTGTCGNNLSSCLKPLPKTYAHQLQYDDFFSKMNKVQKKEWMKGKTPSYPNEKLEGTLLTGIVDKDFASRLCYYWAYSMLAENINQIKGKNYLYKKNPFFNVKAITPHLYNSLESMTSARDDFGKFYDYCAKEIRNNIASVFSITKNIRVYKTGGINIYRGGKSFNINIGAGNSLSFNESMSSSSGLGGEAGGKLFDVFGTKFGVDRSGSSSGSHGMSSGTDVGTYLAMQMVQMDIHTKDVEPCLGIKLNPRFLKKIEFSDEIFKNYSKDFRDYVATQGLMLCSGLHYKGDYKIPETYYFYSQHFVPMGDLVDSANILNNPWLLQLRGTVDHHRFLGHITDTPDLKKTDENFFKLTNLIDPLLSMMLSDQEKALKAFNFKGTDINESISRNILERAFNNMAPSSYPGIMTLPADYAP